MDDARKPAETSTSPEVPHECNPKNGYLRAGRVRSEFSFSWQRDTDNPAAYLSECTKRKRSCRRLSGQAPLPVTPISSQGIPAIAKTDNIYVLGYSLENTLSFSNHFEIGRSRAKIFRLHTPDNPNFHIDSLYKF